MTLSNKPYKGTRDLFPKDKRTLDFLFLKMRQTAESFGYEPYDGPLLEEVELYKAKSGEEIINQQIYSFLDRAGREIAIRPEMTPTLARMVSQIHREHSRPIRWYSIPNLMRYERPQKGRLREHWQYNVDFFGEVNIVAEIEILSLAIQLLKNFGATENHFCIHINNRKFVDHFMQHVLEIDKETSHNLYKIIDRAKKETPESLQKLMQTLPLPDDKQTILKNYLNLNSFQDLLTFCQQQKISKDVWDIESLLEAASQTGIMPYLIFDSSIVRGFDYYTGPVFEIFDKHPDNRRAIAGGGAYANLLQIFGETPLAGIGFGLGDVTLKDFLETHKLLPNFDHPEIHVLISYQSPSAQNIALKIHLELIQRGIKSFLLNEETKLKKLFPMAEKKCISKVIILGEEEMSKNIVSIKNLTSREQKDFSLEDYESMVTFIRGFK